MDCYALTIVYTYRAIFTPRVISVCLHKEPLPRKTLRHSPLTPNVPKTQPKTQPQNLNHNNDKQWR